MQKKLLAMSLLLLVGAGCTSTATIDTTVDATDSAAAAGTQETGTETQNDTPTDTATVEGGTVVNIDLGTDAIEVTNTVAFTVTGNNFAFAPSTMTVKKGDTVIVTFVNSDGFHDFVIDGISGAQSSRLQGGAQETVTFVADTAGSFEYYCSVGEHRAAGMKGTLVVTE